MQRRTLIAGLAAAPLAARAQSSSQPRPLRFVVPFPPGGLADQIIRPVAARLQAVWGQPALVENRAGAGGNLGADLVAKAAPDGYTWLVGSIGPLAANQFLFPTMPYETASAFAPTLLLATTPKVIVVPRDRPWRSLAEMLAAARAQPGALRAGSAGNGSSLHLGLELLNLRAAVRIEHVPYRGAAPAVTDLLGGQIDLLVDNVPNILGQIRGGQLRALAVATEARLPQLPEVPTAAEAGLAGFVFGAWFGLAAPARTPPDIVARMAAGVDAALREPEIGGRLAEQGAVVGGGTPERFAAFLAQQTPLLQAIIRAGNITAD
jgi:tripartite-type tricarboxylate transporter receptor subunit TctC